MSAAQLINEETSPHISGIKISTLSQDQNREKEERIKHKGIVVVLVTAFKLLLMCKTFTFLALMHGGWRRGHLHGQAVSPPERVTVPDNKGSRLPLSQQADSCNTADIHLIHNASIKCSS